MKVRSPVVKCVIDTLGLLARSRRGATAIEYGLILGFMVVAMIIGLTSLANSTTSMWSRVNDSVTNAH